MIGLLKYKSKGEINYVEENTISRNHGTIKLGGGMYDVDVASLRDIVQDLIKKIIRVSV